MEKKQFIFTGLNWLESERIQEISKKLTEVEQETSSEFTFAFIRNSNGLKLKIKYGDNTAILESRISDDCVTFLIKYRFIEDSGIDEDRLLILTIDDDMNLEIAHLYHWGEIR